MKSTIFSICGTLLLVFLVFNSCQQNTSPVAVVSGDSTSFVGDNLLLDGSLSTDADGDSLTFRWSVPTGPEGAGEVLKVVEPASCMFIPDAGGSYKVELVVNDGTIDSDPAALNIEVMDFHGKWKLISRTPPFTTPAEAIDTVVYNEDGTFEYHSWYKYQGKTGLTSIGKGTQDTPVGKMVYTEFTMAVPPSMEIQTFTEDNDPLGVLERANKLNEEVEPGKSVYVLSDGGNTLITKYDGNDDGDFDDIETYSPTGDMIVVWERIK